MVIDKPVEMESEKSELIRPARIGQVLPATKYDRPGLLQTYVSLLEKFPEDVSTLVILGDSYLMAGDAQAGQGDLSDCHPAAA